MTFRQFLQEAGGQEAGKLELVKTDVQKAIEHANSIGNKDLDKEIPNFEKNYKKVQSLAKLGKTKRKDMPVITDRDVKALQYRLSKGFIDVNAPFDKEFKGNPFPEGLTGQKAKEWLEAGLPRHDKGKLTDDIVKVTKEKVKVGDLKPIQQQIYFDKSIKGIMEFGADSSREFFEKTNFITSSDLYIIDGHHRWLAANLIDPNMKVNVIKIDLPINKLLPMTKAYGDAIGNERNK
jgi:hypothetical protein